MKQRITVRYAFQGHKPDEIPAYIRHKTSIAGGSLDILDEDVLSALTTYCQGNSRIIENVMTDAHTPCVHLNKNCIDSKVLIADVNKQALGYNRYVLFNTRRQRFYNSLCAALAVSPGYCKGDNTASLMPPYICRSATNVLTTIALY